MRTVQRALKVKISGAKEVYRRKLKGKLQQKNMKEVWSGMKIITGFRFQAKRGFEGSWADMANKRTDYRF